MRIGFDNDKYISIQSERIKKRIAEFGGKLYLEFGGKLFDDYHASRVLPGFEPDSKIRMLKAIGSEVEIIVAICANDLEKNKRRGDLGISYDDDALRLMDIFRSMGFYVGGVVITQYENQPSANMFRRKLTNLGIRSYKHYPIKGYPHAVFFKDPVPRDPDLIGGIPERAVKVEYYPCVFVHRISLFVRGSAKRREYAFSGTHWSMNFRSASFW